MNKPNSISRHFNGFDGVRAIAAISVVIHHTEQFKHLFNLDSAYSNPIIRGFGSLGVDMFFVLSGFLITFLLISEQSRTDSISIKKFYLRRAFRILPLYFTIIFLAFTFAISFFAQFGGPIGQYSASQVQMLNQLFVPNLLTFGLILPNVAYSILPPLLFASHTWSIGVEEQFYLIWPWVLKEGREYKWLPMFLGAVIGAALHSYALLVINSHDSSVTQIEFYICSYLVCFRLEALALGALAGYICFHHPSLVEKYLGRAPIKALAGPGLIVLLIIGSFLPFGHFTFALLTAILLLAIQNSGTRYLNFEFLPLKYLGRMSYGIYMWHSYAIFFALLVFQKMDWLANVSPAMNAVLTVLVFIFTFLISDLSYRFLETPFLKIKERFSA